MPVDLQKAVEELQRRGLKAEPPAAPSPSDQSSPEFRQAASRGTRELERAVRNRQLAGQFDIQGAVNELKRRGVKAELAREPDVSAAQASEARLKAIDTDLLAKSHSSNPAERKEALREITTRATELEFANQFGQAPPDFVTGPAGSGPVEAPPFEEWLQTKFADEINRQFDPDPERDGALRAQRINELESDPALREEYNAVAAEAETRGAAFERGSEDYLRTLRDQIQGKKTQTALEAAKIKAVPGILQAEAKAREERPGKIREEVNKLNSMVQANKTLQNFRLQAAAVRTVNQLGSKPNPSNADDLSLIYAYVKLLDPGSVVREGEIRLAREATPLLGRLTQNANKLFSTKNGILDPRTRATYLQSSKEIAKTITESARPEFQRVAGLADERGVPLEKVFNSPEREIIQGGPLNLSDTGAAGAAGAAPSADSDVIIPGQTGAPAPTAAPPVTPTTPGAPTTKVVIQNGVRFVRQPDGSYIAEQ